MRQNRPRHGFARTLARPASRRPALRDVEVLEGRELLSTFTVTSLRGSGAGSLRQAIAASNSQPGPNTIDFAVDGTIHVGRASLPEITNTVAIDGTSAPGFAGSPVVTINFQGTRGLLFQSGSEGSSLRSLALVKADGAGVTLVAPSITVQGNDIGLKADGKTVAGNSGSGIRINAASSGDLIGQLDPVTGVTYYNSDSVGMQPVSGWQGIRDSTTAGQYLITGTSGDNGLLYEGPISGSGGTSYAVDYPGATSTSVYGPDVVSGETLRLVGSYKTGDGQVNGFAFQGTVADLSNSDDYQTIDFPGAAITYVHSTAGDLSVGNAGDIAATTDNAFIYSDSLGHFLGEVNYPGASTFTTTAYGIWYNGGTSYTICGGYTAPGAAGQPLAQAYLVDYDSSTGQFSHWTSFAGPQGLVGPSFATHFQGISSPQPGVYTLSANVTQANSSTPFQAELATVKVNADGSFSPATWTAINYPGSSGLCTADSVAGNQVVGIAYVGSSIVTYQSTVDLGFQASNVIGGNGGNGIAVYGATDDQIAMNNIGTDASGTRKRGNAENGILLTKGASGNLIGGTVSAGNSPTQGVFVRPPQGNLISGNDGDGVLMTDGATGNTMSGNFVGTTASGDAKLGNAEDGVAIVRADGNALIGCTMQDEPFIYYNVLSGNGGNGLRITNSNDTTVQADFMGAGANNATVVANHGDGLLVSGHSAETQVGGVIPLGNVISGNDHNGIDLTDTASGFTSFNTFGGTFAFGGAAPNKEDGILITSTGGDNLIRTSIIGGNGGNGIEIGGQATGVQVSETAVGTNSAINSPIPNGGDGIKIDGHAHGNEIGGFQPSIEPQVTASSNDGYGIAVVGSAHDNQIFHTDVGSNSLGTEPLPNAMGGIDLGSGTSATTIGGAASPDQVKVLYNDGPGLTIDTSQGNLVTGDEIMDGSGTGVLIEGKSSGTGVQDDAISGNAGDGVTLKKARHVTIGGNTSGTGSQAAAGAGNTIAINKQYGLSASGNCKGSVVEGNTIVANGQGSVDLSQASGITYIPKTGA